MFTTNSISKGNSYQIWYSCEGILKNLNPSVGDDVKINKNIRHVEIFSDCFSCEIDKQKLIVDDYSLIVDCAVNNDEVILSENNLINIIAMPKGNIFHLDVVLNDDSLLWIVYSKSNTTVSSIGDESNKTIVASNFDRNKIIGSSILFLGNVVFGLYGDAIVVGSVEIEIIS